MHVEEIMNHVSNASTRYKLCRHLLYPKSSHNLPVVASVRCRPVATFWWQLPWTREHLDLASAWPLMVFSCDSEWNPSWPKLQPSLYFKVEMRVGPRSRGTQLFIYSLVDAPPLHSHTAVHSSVPPSVTVCDLVVQCQHHTSYSLGVCVVNLAPPKCLML